MLPSEQRLVQEVIDRLTFMQQLEADSEKLARMIPALQEEFGADAVRWGYRFFVALGVAERRRMASAARGPLWDRDLDGGAEATGLMK